MNPFIKFKYAFLGVSCCLFLFACRPSQQSTTTASSSSTNKTKPKGDDFDAYLEHKKNKFVGRTLPDAPISTLKGKTFNREKLQGKLVLLNFWFAACKPCITEIPSLNELHRKYASKGLVILSISTDKPAVIRPLIESKKIKYRLGANGQAWAKRMEVTSYPTSYLIDRKGVIRQVFIGGSSFDATQMYMEVKPHLEALLLE